ncbi:hypothetical protein C8J57DRAFT_1252323 [Mycena rebaudengoi]|nr:hypothetical protein C8J57DRAFT_1252323 [Mycena rebaudengoi]
MAPPGWTTEDERTFLFLQLPEYIQRAAAGKLGLFWGSVFEAFLHKFPERAKLGLPSATETGDAAQLMTEQRTVLENAIKKRKKQIETWFRYQKKKTRNNSTVAAATNSQASLASTLFTAPVRRRVHKAIEIFQKRHVAIIRDALEKAGYDELDGANMPEAASGGDDTANNTHEAHAKRIMSQRMQLRVRVVRELFDAASAEEKASIDEELEEEKEKALKEEAEVGEYKKTPAALQKSIDDLTGALGKVLNIAEKESGWVAMTIIGGPNPRNGGGLSVKVVCTGETPIGNDFKSFFPNFDTVITGEFFNFLRAVFPADVRAACALPTGSGGSDDVTEQAVDRDAAEVLHSDQPGESDSSPKTANMGKKPKKKKKKKTTVLAPATVEATSSGVDDAALLTTSMHDTRVDSDDPFLNPNPFAGVSPESLAMLDRASLLGADWSWAEYAAGRPPLSSSALPASAFSPAATPPASSPVGSSGSSQLGLSPGRSSFLPSPSPAVTPPMSSPVGSSTSAQLRLSPGLASSAPSPPPSPSPPPRSLSGMSLPISVHRGGLPTLFEAFKAKTTALNSTAFSFTTPTSVAPPWSFATPTPYVAPPWPTATWSLPPTFPNASAPVSSGAPSPPTPAHQPTRAAQMLSSFLSPERRAGAGSPALQTTTGPLLPGAAAHVGIGGMSGPALPQTRPAVKQPKAVKQPPATKQPVEQTIRPVLRRGRPAAKAFRDGVLSDATNGTVARADGATHSTTPGAVMDVPPSQNGSATSQAEGATVGTQNDAAEPAPPAEKKREGQVRRAPVRADGTAAVGWTKRKSDEMNTDAEGPTPPQPGRKKRKTSAA